MNHTKTKEKIYTPLVVPKDRLLIWREAKGMWKNRKPDPTRELEKMRKEWERKLV